MGYLILAPHNTQTNKKQKTKTQNMVDGPSTSKGKRKSVKSSAGSKTSARSAFASQQSSGRAATSAKIQSRRMTNPIQAKGMKRMEKKFTDDTFFSAGNANTRIVTTECNSAGIVRFVGGEIVQGTGDYANRIGRSIILKSFQFEGTLKANSAATAQKIKWYLILDDEPGAALPAWTDLFDAVSGQGVTGNAAFYDMRNLATTDRFTVLKSGTTTISGTGNEDNIQDLNFFYKPPQDIEIRYKAANAGTGLYNSIEKGALLFCAIGTNATGTSASTITASYRLRYTDP